MGCCFSKVDNDYYYIPLQKINYRQELALEIMSTYK